MDAVADFPTRFSMELPESQLAGVESLPPAPAAPTPPPGFGQKPQRNYWARLEPSQFVRYPRYEPISYLAEMRLIQRAQQGDLAARQEIWARNTGLALSAVNRFRVPTHLLADAIQEGIVGINRAIDKYEVERFNAFSTYAWYWVYQHIHRFLDNHRHFVRVPPHLRRSFYSHLNADHGQSVSPAELATFQNIRRVLRPSPIHEIPTEALPVYYDHRATNRIDDGLLRTQLASILPSRERFVIQHRFGLNGRKPKTLASIAKRLGITRERVRQIERRSLDRLRRKLPAGFDPSEPDRRTRQNNEKQISVVIRKPVPADSKPANVPPPRMSTQDLEEYLLRTFKHFPFRQSNAVIHFYGLMRHTPLPLPDVAELLELSHRKTWLALRNGRKKLLSALNRTSCPELIALRRRIADDTSYRSCLSDGKAPCETL